MSASTRPLVHAGTCGRPNVRERTFPDRPGWAFVRCSTCRETGWRPLDTPDETPEAVDEMPEAVDETPEAPPSAWVCREHHTPVTWRGTGCPRCTPQLRRRRRRRSAPPDKEHTQ